MACGKYGGYYVCHCDLLKMKEDLRIKEMECELLRLKIRDREKELENER